MGPRGEARALPSLLVRRQRGSRFLVARNYSLNAEAPLIVFAFFKDDSNRKQQHFPLIELKIHWPPLHSSCLSYQTNPSYRFLCGLAGNSTRLLVVTFQCSLFLKHALVHECMTGPLLCLRWSHVCLYSKPCPSTYAFSRSPSAGAPSD